MDEPPAVEHLVWEPDPATLKRARRTALFITPLMTMMIALVPAMAVDLFIAYDAEEMSDTAVTVWMGTWAVLTVPAWFVERRSLEVGLRRLALVSDGSRLSYVRPTRGLRKKGDVDLAGVKRIDLVEGNNRFGTHAMSRQATEVQVVHADRWKPDRTFLAGRVPTAAFGSLEEFLRQVCECAGVELEVHRQRPGGPLIL